MKAKTTSQLSRNALLISLPLLNWPLIIYLTGHPLSALGALIIALWIAGLIGPILNVAKRLYELQINAYNRQVASSQIQEIPDLTGWASYLPTVIMFSAIIGSGISWFLLVGRLEHHFHSVLPETFWFASKLATLVVMFAETALVYTHLNYLGAADFSIATVRVSEFEMLGKGSYDVYKELQIMYFGELEDYFNQNMIKLILDKYAIEHNWDFLGAFNRREKQKYDQFLQQYQSEPFYELKQGVINLSNL